jgi:ribokinase
MRTVFVAGSVNMDLVARCARLPRAGETVPGQRFERHPGGKGANQAVACAKLGARARFCGAVGSDAFGEELRAFLLQHGIDVEHLASHEQTATGIAAIAVDDSGENQIVVVPGANALVSTEAVERLPIAAGDLALAQLEIPVATTARFLEHARAAGARTLLNPAPAIPVPNALLDAADFLIVNELELAAYSGVPELAVEPEAVLEAARRLRRRSDPIVIVTLGKRGAVALDGMEAIVVPGRSVPVVDTTGAGDTFVGALAASLAGGWTLPEALHRANAAAAFSVQRPGASESSPTASQLAEVV